MNYNGRHSLSKLATANYGACYHSDDNEEPPKLIAVVGDMETCVGFVLGGIGQEIRTTSFVDGGHSYNYYVVERETNVEDIEKAFEAFLMRNDVNIIIINQKIADRIRPVIDSRREAIPAILEIPSSDQPYDWMKDNIMKRAKSLHQNHGKF